MKQCPFCKNTYTDKTLIFCLSDGTRLVDFEEPAATVQFPSNVKPTEANYGRVNIPITAPSMETKFISPPVITTQSEKKGCSPLAVAAIFGVLGIFAIAGIGAGYYFYKDNLVAQTNSPTPTPTATPNNDSNSKEQELKEKLDKLQKQLDDQKRPVNKSTPTVNPTPPQSSGKTAQVEAPDDGFLAMRSGPDHISGYQIMKMPHGATVNVFNCKGSKIIAGKSGHWCQVSYGGNNGWAFDAWLVY